MAAAMLGAAAIGGISSYFAGKQRAQSQARANRRNIKLARENRKFNKREAERNRAFQSMEAKTNRQFQERMANTTHQRQIKDMKKAGLNPMLAATQGGAPAPSGAQASGAQATGDRAEVSPEDPEARELIEGLTSGALQAKRLKEDISVMKKQKQKIKAETEKTKTENKIRKKDVPLAEAKAEIAKTAKKYLDPILEDFGTSAKSAKKTYNNIKNKSGSVIDSVDKHIPDSIKNAKRPWEDSNYGKKKKSSASGSW